MLSHVKHRSEKLLDEILPSLNNKADKGKIQSIIKSHFQQIHDSAVEQTRMASNKREFVAPQFLDL